MPKKAKKTTMYLEEKDEKRVKRIKNAIGSDHDSVAIRYAIRNVPLPS